MMMMTIAKASSVGRAKGEIFILDNKQVVKGESGMKREIRSKNFLFSLSVQPFFYRRKPGSKKDRPEHTHNKCTQQSLNLTNLNLT